ncbi:MAG: hypothetical protein ACREYE_11265 [Gammaproteobacteria bacterium]
MVDEAHHLRNDVLEDLRLLDPLRDGLRKPPVFAPGGAHRAPPPPLHGRARIPRPTHRRAPSPARTHP